MATVPLEHVAHEGEWKLPSRGVVAMASLITAEASIFTIFVVAYLYYLGRDVSGPFPKDVLEIPYFGTVCLLSSSGFIMLAERAIEHGRMAAFRLWWIITILLGAIFLVDTGMEWYKLIRSRSSDDSYEFIWDDFLLARRPARVARGGRTADDADGDGVCTDGALAR